MRKLILLLAVCCFVSFAVADQDFTIQDSNGNPLFDVDGDNGDVRIPEGNLNLEEYNSIEQLDSLSYEVIEVNGAKTETFESASIQTDGDISGADWGTWTGNANALSTPYEGSQGAELRGGNSITSPNLSSTELSRHSTAGRVYLQAWLWTYNDNERAYVELSTDGGSSFQTVRVLDNDQGTNTRSNWNRISVDITPYLPSQGGSGDIRVRFREGGGGGGDQFRIDNVQLIHAPNRGAFNLGTNEDLFYSGGQVGLGTSSPESQLDVSGNTDLRGNVDLNSNSINNIGGLQNCGSDEFVNGNGDCTADSNTNTQNPINGDLVAGSGLSGGSNDVLPGGNSDVTVSLSADDLDSQGNIDDFSAASDLNQNGDITSFDDASDLNSNGDISSFDNANDLNSNGDISSFDNANDLDNSGNLQTDTVADNEINDNTVDNSEIQNSDTFQAYRFQSGPSNNDGNGIVISDDGGFFDDNDGYVTFDDRAGGSNTQGLRIGSGNLDLNGSNAVNGCFAPDGSCSAGNEFLDSGGLHATSIYSGSGGEIDIQDTINFNSVNMKNIQFEDAADLDSTGNVVDFDNANDLDNSGNIADFSAAASLSGGGDLVSIDSGDGSINSIGTTSNGRLYFAPERFGSSDFGREFGFKNSTRRWYTEGGLSAESYRIVNVADPSSAQDAATKSYVDNSDDTISDDQPLSDVLSRGNNAGGTPINFNQNEDIQSSGTDAITLDGNQNVGIPNGRLSVEGETTIGSFDDRHVELESANSNWGWVIETHDYGNGKVPLEIVRKKSGTYTPVINVTQNGDLDLSSNNVLNPNQVDGVDLDNPGNAITKSGDKYAVASGSIDDNEIADNTVDNSEIQNGDNFNFNGVTTSGGGVDLNGGSLDIDIDPDQLRFRSDNSPRNMYDVLESGSRKWSAVYTNEGLNWEDAGGVSTLQLEQDNDVIVPNGNLDVGGNSINNIGDLGQCSNSASVYLDGNGTCQDLSTNTASYINGDLIQGDTVDSNEVDVSTFAGSGIGGNADSLAINTGNALTTNSDSVAVSSNSIADSELADNSVDNSEIQNGDDFTLGGLDLRGNLRDTNDGNTFITGPANDGPVLTVDKTLNSPAEEGLLVQTDGDVDDDTSFEIRSRSSGGSVNENNTQFFVAGGNGNTGIGIEYDGANGVGSTPDFPNDQLEVGGQIDVRNNKVVNVADPTNAQDAATKSYVDSSDDTIADNQGLPDVLNNDNTANGQTIDDLNRVGDGGNGNYLDFTDNSGWVEVQDSSGSREQIVTEDTYINEDGFWLGDENLVDINANNGLTGGGTSGLTDGISLGVASGGISDNEIADNSVDNSEIQNGDSFTFNGITTRSNINVNNNNLDDVASIDGGGDAIQVNNRLGMNKNDIRGANRLITQGPGGGEGILWGGTNAEVTVAPLDDSNSDGYLQLVNDGGIAFEPGGDSTTSAVMTSGGRLGLGTTSPQKLLDVNGDVRIRGDLDVWGTIQNTNVTNLNVQGSILPPAGYNATFDVGNATRRWRNARFSGVGTFGSGLTVSSGSVDVPAGTIQNTELANSAITVSANSGLSGGGTPSLGGTVGLSHTDTSSQSDISSSGGTVIQDLNFDTYGHVAGATSYNLDNRYYTESESDSNFVDASGDTMTGNLAIDTSGLEALTVGNGDHAEHYIRFRNAADFGSTIGYDPNVGDNGGTRIQSGDEKDLVLAVGNGTFGEGTAAIRIQENGNVGIPNSITNFFAPQCPTGEVVAQVNNDGSYTCVSITDTADDTYVNENGDTMTGDLGMSYNRIGNVSELNVSTSTTQIAHFSDTGIEFDQPLTLESSGPLSVANGVELTGTSSNTIESYSTMYLTTSSGSVSDIVLNPTGSVGIDANASVTGNIDLQGDTLQNANLESQSVDEGEINQNTLDDSEIQDNTLTEASVAADSIGDSEMIDETIDDSEVDNNQLTEASLASGSVTDSEITDDINLNDLNNVYANALYDGDGGSQIEVQDNIGMNALDINNANIVNTNYVQQAGGNADIEFSSGNINLRDSNNNDVLRAKDGGNVEIPNGKLQVTSSTSSNMAMEFRPGGAARHFRVYSRDEITAAESPVVEIKESSNFNTGQMFLESDGTYNIATGGTAGVQIDTSQNVNIPNGNLDINGPSNTGGVLDIGGNMNVNGIDNSGGGILRPGPIKTYGRGTDDITIYDRHNENNMAVFDEGGPTRFVNPISNKNIIRMNYSGGSNVEIPNGNLNVNNQLSVGSTECNTGEFLDGDGTCTSVTGTTNDDYVNEAGDTMTGDLDMNSNSVLNVGTNNIDIGDGQGNIAMNGQRIVNGGLVQVSGIGVTDSLSTAENEVSGNSIYVQGDVSVDGDFVGAGADVAETISNESSMEPGTVVKLSGNMSIDKSTKARDTAVAGVVSKDPAMVMAKERDGVPVAMSGTVPVKFSAENGGVKPGDMLTTASKDGHAMKCSNLARCQGAIIGKAMQSQSSTGKVKMLVSRG